MRERTLITISLVGTIVGIIVLFFITENFDLKSTKDSIELEGVVEQISTSSDVTFMEIRPSDTITAVAFKELDIPLGKKVKLKGDFKKYKNNVEFVVEEVAGSK